MNIVYKIIIQELNDLIGGKTIKEIIDFETDNIYNKSAVSSIIRIGIVNVLWKEPC